MSLPLISVIVPVYNVAPYLAQCLQSIVGQSYRALEILVVDDGSTDGSGAIANEWAKRDGRIKVIHQPNGGLSSARNTALNAMQGELVTMVDSDDFLPPGAIGHMQQLMAATGADIVVGDNLKFNDGSVPVLPPCEPHGENQRYSASEAFDAIYYQHGLDNSAWAKLYRSRLFAQVRYPAGMLYEDLAIVPQLLAQVQLVVSTAAVVYCYRQQRAASILGHFNPNRAHVLDILELQEQQMALTAPQHVPAVRSRRMSAALNMLRLIPRYDAQYAPLQQRAWAMVRQLRRETLMRRRTRLRNKVAALISFLGLGALLRAINGR